jgi:hypothetical protein
MSTSVPPVQTSFEAYLRKSWFHRNWKWFVPTLIVLGFVCFGVSVISLVQYSFRHSDAYEMALRKARQSSTVAGAVGPSIKPGLFIGGSIHIAGATGWAELSIPVSAERGKGTISITASKRDGHWEPKSLVFENAANGERTDLLQEELPLIKEQ